MQKAVIYGVRAIQKYTKTKHVPVLTGDLRNSIVTENINELKSRVLTNLEYAPYVEYGTRYQRPQPYLRPATEDARKPTREFAKELMNKELRNIFK
jgi:HK97 gp10 family phage protein